MNTSALKNFAQSARTQLIAQVGTQLDRALNATGALAQEFAAPIKALQDEISRHGRAHVVEEAAYLWFNRFVALRFMDVNDYADLRAVSPATDADALPELLQLAKAGQLPDDLKVNRARLNDLLDGRLPSTKPEAEVYRILLRAECNRRHAQLPFLFERITDYSELLLPADLLSQQSILHQLRETLTEETCKDNEEVIGWLYQFYISEKKDAVFASKAKVKKEDIPAVTQLFTPRWIVEYMVQNTLGKLWLQGHPDSSLRDHMPYYLESPETPSPDPSPRGRGDVGDRRQDATIATSPEQSSAHSAAAESQAPPPWDRRRQQRSSRVGEGVHEQSELFPAAAKSHIANPILTPQELTLADQACGSGHILLYAFELLTRIYEESGYAKSEIPALILAHNLTGFEIDERAAQLAAFTLMMRARRYHRSSLRRGLAPNIVRFQDLPLSPEQSAQTLTEQGITASKELRQDLTLMQQATNFGSLITPTASPEEIIRARTQVQSKLAGADLFAANALRQLDVALHQLAELSRKFWCVVDNPPYMGSGNMNPALSKYVKKEYPLSKSDLMATFMERGLQAVHESGFLGMINQHSWMFLSSYEKLRARLIADVHFDTMLHLGPRAFPEIGGEVVQSTAFTFRNHASDHPGVYLRLVDDKTTEGKAQKAAAASIDSSVDYLFHASQADFAKIPGSPVGYWVSEKVIEVFDNSKSVRDFAEGRTGLATGENDYYLRFWYEVVFDQIGFGLDRESAVSAKLKWFPYNKGGTARKWSGNKEYVVNWFNDGHEMQSRLHPSGNRIWAHNFNLDYIFKPHLSWPDVTSGGITFRYYEKGFLFDSSGAAAFVEGEDEFKLLSYLNWNFVGEIGKLLNPTIHFKNKDFHSLPYTPLNVKDEPIAQEAVFIASSDWNRQSLSFEFEGYEFAPHHSIISWIDLFYKNWSTKFLRLHKLEEINNRIHAEAYGVLDEVLPQISLQDITILQQELDRKALSQLNKKLKRDPATGLVTNYDELELPFKRDEIMAQFISYAVGCMLGRYSLDKEGLILANAGDGIREYRDKVGKEEKDWTFAPDEDGILPVLAGEYFPDDIVGRFRVFLRAAFGEEHFVENLAFVEECIGKDIRSYFVRDFYKDHVKRYKKRPIYWMFQSPGKHFRALVYLHRYQPNTVGRLLNDYLRPFIDRLTTERDNAQAVKDNAGSTAAASAQASKTIDSANQALRDCEAYQKDLLELARRRIDLDLDDGVLVNYNKMGDAVETITGVNDAKGRKKVRGFDWVEWEW